MYREKNRIQIMVRRAGECKDCFTIGKWPDDAELARIKTAISVSGSCSFQELKKAISTAVPAIDVRGIPTLVYPVLEKDADDDCTIRTSSSLPVPGSRTKFHCLAKAEFTTKDLRRTHDFDLDDAVSKRTSRLADGVLLPDTTRNLLDGGGDLATLAYIVSEAYVLAQEELAAGSTPSEVKSVVAAFLNGFLIPRLASTFTISFYTTTRNTRVLCVSQGRSRLGHSRGPSMSKSFVLPKGLLESEDELRDRLEARLEEEQEGADLLTFERVADLVDKEKEWVWHRKATYFPTPVYSPLEYSLRCHLSNLGMGITSSPQSTPRVILDRRIGFQGQEAFLDVYSGVPVMLDDIGDEAHLGFPVELSLDAIYSLIPVDLTPGFASKPITYQLHDDRAVNIAETVTILNRAKFMADPLCFLLVCQMIVVDTASLLKIEGLREEMDQDDRDDHDPRIMEILEEGRLRNGRLADIVERWSRASDVPFIVADRKARPLIEVLLLGIAGSQHLSKILGVGIHPARLDLKNFLAQLHLGDTLASFDEIFRQIVLASNIPLRSVPQPPDSIPAKRKRKSAAPLPSGTEREKIKAQLEFESRKLDTDANASLTELADEYRSLREIHRGRSDGGRSYGGSMAEAARVYVTAADATKACKDQLKVRFSNTVRPSDEELEKFGTALEEEKEERMRKREEEGEGEGEGEVDWMARLNDGLPIPRFSRSDDETLWDIITENKRRSQSLAMLAKGRRRGFEPGDDISPEQLIAQTIYQAALQERSLHDQDVAISYCDARFPTLPLGSGLLIPSSPLKPSHARTTHAKKTYSSGFSDPLNLSFSGFDPTRTNFRQVSTSTNQAEATGDAEEMAQEIAHLRQLCPLVVAAGGGMVEMGEKVERSLEAFFLLLSVFKRGERAAVFVARILLAPAAEIGLDAKARRRMKEELEEAFNLDRSGDEEERMEEDGSAALDEVLEAVDVFFEEFSE